MDMSSMASTNTMAMASSTAGAAMSMPTPSSDAMAMADMDTTAMVFFTSTNTPLWSSTFSPSTTGQYTGICIFLIAFAVIFRLLLALRVNFYEILAAAEQRRNNGGRLQLYAIELKQTAARPWTASEAVMMASIDVVIAGVSYLLMLAVMTLNVGYFLSILGGVFLGSMVCGRFIGSSGAH